ncbi:hypothetical protein Pcinc_024312, partial [Petrolisthes cinctipes]
VTLASKLTNPQQPQPRVTCSIPFQPVGDHCIFADYLISGSWEEVREVCVQMKGDLVGFQDANTLADLVQFLKQNDIDTASYWTGANDREAEGLWRWASDQSLVHMNTPLWGDLTTEGQEPMGGKDEDGAAILLEDYYFMHDLNCNESLPLICEKPAEPNTLNTSQEVEQHNRVQDPIQCSERYVDIGGRCLFVNSPSDGTWDEMKAFCELLNGRLAKVDDANLLGAIFDYLLAHDKTEQHIYIGGSDIMEEGKWVWLDGTSITMGTPFWGNEEMEGQEPMGYTIQNCLVLSNGDYFLFHDFGCDNEIGAICEEV